MTKSSSTKRPHKGGRQPTGTLLRTRDGRLRGRITLPDGRRICTPPFPAGTSEEMAREKTKALREGLLADPRFQKQSEDYLADKRERDSAGTTECSAWVDAWHADRVRRGLTSARDSKSHWNFHLSQVLGAKHPQNWTRDDFRKLSAALDSKVQAGVISPKTAVNAWTTATGMASEAASSKLDALCCRTDNPADGVRGPSRGEGIALQYLYPNEVARFLGCEAVPLRWRRVVAVAVYTFTRVGELRALEWSDVDLVHQTISITRAIDRTSGGTKSTKSKSPRLLPIEPELLPLLKVLASESGGVGKVISDLPSERDLSRGLRRWLARAKVDRPGLFERGPSVRPIRFHDLRATGITWMAARGDEAIRIQQRAGHTSFTTTERYLRPIASVGAFGVPFCALPTGLVSSEETSTETSPKEKPPYFYEGFGGADGTRTRLETPAGEVPAGFLGVDPPSEHPADEAKCATTGAVTIAGDDCQDVVEAALLEALKVATAARDLVTIGRVAAELGERRRARAGVVSLSVERARRGQL